LPHLSGKDYWKLKKNKRLFYFPQRQKVHKAVNMF